MIWDKEDLQELLVKSFEVGRIGFLIGFIVGSYFGYFVDPINNFSDVALAFVGSLSAGSIGFVIFMVLHANISSTIKHFKSFKKWND